jgi:2,3-dihydroxyphenylpropionate 1,2-dioxygenase
MSTSRASSSEAFVACVPHVPLLAMQARAVNAAMWDAYEARAAELRAFDPELVVVFGGDHYDGVHLKMMPTFVVGQIATGLSDCGGHAGPLNVPQDIAYACAEDLIERGFDIATSYAMEVDHGFTNVIHNFLGSLQAKPVLPIHINAMCDPKPTFKRCRELGEAVGRFAATLGKRVAFLGSGGLSHQTDFIFPQYTTAPNETIRDFIVHGGVKGELSRDKWMADIQTGMNGLNGELLADKFHAPWINKEWDEQFLRVLSSGDLRQFDAWKCSDVTKAAGYGGGEIRQWIAAAAAGHAAGIKRIGVDYYSAETKLAVGVGVASGCTR